MHKKYSCFFFLNDVHVSWDDYNFILVLYLHPSKGAIIPFEDAAKEWAVWWGIVSLCFVELGISFEQSNQNVLQIITRHIHTPVRAHTQTQKQQTPWNFWCSLMNRKDKTFRVSMEQWGSRGRSSTTSDC